MTLVSIFKHILQKMDHNKYPRFSADDETEFSEKLVFIMRNSKIDKVTIADEYNDDDCLCFNIEMSINGEKYYCGLWWEGSIMRKLLYQAEVSQECRNKLSTFLVEQYDNY